MPLDPIISRGVAPVDVTNTLYTIARMNVADREERRRSRTNDLLERRLESQEKQAGELEERKQALAKVQWALRSPSPAKAILDDPEAVMAFTQQGMDLVGLDDARAKQMLEYAQGQMAAQLGMGPPEQTAPKRDVRQVGGALVEVPLEGDPRELYRAPQQAPQYAPAGYREVTLMENGVPVAYMVNERNPNDRVKLGETQGKPGSAVGTSVNPLGMNDRQLAGLNMQRENAISYAANLTGTDRGEVERILASEGPDGVYRLMTERGKRTLQGAPARVVQSLPFGKTIVEATNADLIAPAKGGGAGIALLQNPTGPVATADFQAGEAQFPNATYPLATQAEMVRQMLQSGQGAAQSATQGADDPLAQYAGQVIKQGNKRYQVMQGADGRYFAQELK
jgi:hypothetical protein